MEKGAGPIPVRLTWVTKQCDRVTGRLTGSPSRKVGKDLKSRKNTREFKSRFLKSSLVWNGRYFLKNWRNRVLEQSLRGKGQPKRLPIKEWGRRERIH